ncbi:MAG: flagellar biosynthetic protein FliQ [Planctomycetota bacterium]|nr:flagellar biosynthetic protein FliQ [Planctomycetota bacterium]
METIEVVAIAREFFGITLLLCAPVVIVSLIVGLVISIGQTVTSIQEQTLTFAPRIVAVVALLMWLASWYLDVLRQYTLNLFARMVEIVG